MGEKTVYTFSVSSSGQRIATLDSRDLKAAGYTWEPLTDCAGILRFKSKAIAITCDAPAMASGSNDKPLVLEVPEGGGAPTGSSRTTPRTSASFQPQPSQQPYSTPADVVAAYRPR
jgi:zona occludens toxin